MKSNKRRRRERERAKVNEHNDLSPEPRVRSVKIKVCYSLYSQVTFLFILGLSCFFNDFVFDKINTSQFYKQFLIASDEISLNLLYYKFGTLSMLLCFDTDTNVRKDGLKPSSYLKVMSNFCNFNAIFHLSASCLSINRYKTIWQMQ